jgi:hypothetical protein
VTTDFDRLPYLEISQEELRMHMFSAIALSSLGWAHPSHIAVSDALTKLSLVSTQAKWWNPLAVVTITDQ